MTSRSFTTSPRRSGVVCRKNSFVSSSYDPSLLTPGWHSLLLRHARLLWSATVAPAHRWSALGPGSTAGRPWAASACHIHLQSLSDERAQTVLSEVGLHEVAEDLDDDFVALSLLVLGHLDHGARHPLQLAHLKTQRSIGSRDSRLTYTPTMVLYSKHNS